jgi:ATP-binding cassette subfamily C protein
MQPILRTSPELDENKESPGELAGHLEVRGATFRYSENGPAILQDVSLEIKPGEFIALVGRWGSGKSTLLRLLLGFEKPQSGGIYYDGKDLSTLDCREIRRQIGVVLQSGRVAPGSILDNIRGAANLSEDDVWEAARLAGLDEDIKNMPMGLHTFVSPGGETLSGGQRQRLLIAGALIRKPRILYFDEATSALDNRTQEIISSSLSQLRATRVVVAHRLSTIVHADCIHVVDKGRIVESGTYSGLLKEDGVFAALVKRQII